MATIEKAKADLIYKLSSRDTSPYKEWTLGTTITLQQAIASYRAITGACENGVRQFMATRGQPPATMTVQEVLDNTKGTYGHAAYMMFFKQGEETF